MVSPWTPLWRQTQHRMYILCTNRSHNDGWMKSDARNTTPSRRQHIETGRKQPREDSTQRKQQEDHDVIIRYDNNSLSEDVPLVRQPEPAYPSASSLRLDVGSSRQKNRPGWRATWLRPHPPASRPSRTRPPPGRWNLSANDQTVSRKIGQYSNRKG